MGILAAGRFSVTDLQALATDLQYYVDVHIATLLAFVLGFTVLPARRRGPPGGRTGPFVRYGDPAGRRRPDRLDGADRARHRGGQQLDGRARLRLHRPEQLHDQPGPYALMRTKVPITVAPSFTDPYTDVPAIFSMDRGIAAGSTPSAATRRVVDLHRRGRGDAHGETLSEHPITANRVTADLGTLDLRDRGACLTATWARSSSSSSRRRSTAPGSTSPSATAARPTSGSRSPPAATGRPTTGRRPTWAPARTGAPSWTGWTAHRYIRWCWPPRCPWTTCA